MGDLTLSQALDDYKAVYMAYRNFAERTRVEYLNDLSDLIEFLEKSGINQVKGLSLPIIERYVAQLEQKGVIKKTPDIATLGSFWGNCPYIGSWRRT